MIENPKIGMKVKCVPGCNCFHPEIGTITERHFWSGLYLVTFSDSSEDYLAKEDLYEIPNDNWVDGWE